jgi:hypothetical protein
VDKWEGRLVVEQWQPRPPWLFILGHFLLQNLTSILVHQAGALHLRIQEDLQRQDQALLPTTEEDAIMAVEQLLLIDLVAVHL